MNDGLVKLKQWMIERDGQLLELVKRAEQTTRRSGFVFGLDEEDEQVNARLDRDIAVLEGERRGLRTAFDALNRFAVHPFVEESHEPKQGS